LATLARTKWSKNGVNYVRPNATFIHLDMRGVTELDDSIGNLTHLTELNCSSNQLTELPDSISNLTNLTALHCFNNQLTELPDSIGNLTRLTELSCSTNWLKRNCPIRLASS
jgi:internalin A